MWQRRILRELQSCEVFLGILRRLLHPVRLDLGPPLMLVDCTWPSPLQLLLHLVQRYHPHRSVFQPRRRTGPGRPLGCRAFGPRNPVPTVLRRPLACPRFDAMLPPPSPVHPAFALAYPADRRAAPDVFSPPRLLSLCGVALRPLLDRAPLPPPAPRTRPYPPHAYPVPLQNVPDGPPKARSGPPENPNPRHGRSGSRFLRHYPARPPRRPIWLQR
jgi:hypothetical protein